MKMSWRANPSLLLGNQTPQGSFIHRTVSGLVLYSVVVYRISASQTCQNPRFYLLCPPRRLDTGAAWVPSGVVGSASRSEA